MVLQIDMLLDVASLRWSATAKWNSNKQWAVAHDCLCPYVILFYVCTIYDSIKLSCLLLVLNFTLIFRVKKLVLQTFKVIQENSERGIVNNHISAKREEKWVYVSISDC